VSVKKKKSFETLTPGTEKNRHLKKKLNIKKFKIKNLAKKEGKRVRKKRLQRNI